MTSIDHTASSGDSSGDTVKSSAQTASQPAAQGALPTLYAATSPDAEGGAYYGPNKMGEVRGLPGVAKIPPQALDLEASLRLWKLSEELAGVSFE